MSQKHVNSKKSLEAPLLDLSNAVGDFIRYWGFRRIHGQIWTELYLRKTPLSGSELTKCLNVSKALVSPALAELEGYNLIQLSDFDGKTKKYSANPDVFEVIRKVLQTREKVLIEKAFVQFQKLARQQPGRSDQTSEDSVLNLERLEALGGMIEMARFGIEFITNSEAEAALMQMTGTTKGPAL